MSELCWMYLCFSSINRGEPLEKGTIVPSEPEKSRDPEQSTFLLALSSATSESYEARNPKYSSEPDLYRNPAPRSESSQERNPHLSSESYETRNPEYSSVSSSSRNPLTNSESEHAEYPQVFSELGQNGTLMRTASQSTIETQGPEVSQTESEVRVNRASQPTSYFQRERDTKGADTLYNRANHSVEKPSGFSGGVPHE